MTVSLAVSLVLAGSFQPRFAERHASPTGGISLAFGVLSEPLRGELGAAARAYALSQREQLDLPTDSTLGVPTVFSTRLGASIHLQQEVVGLPVHGAKVVVTVDQARRVSQLTSSLVRYRQTVMTWTTSPVQALRAAARSVPFARLQPNGEPYGAQRREAFAVGDEVHGGYLVHVPSADPLAYWVVAVDAVTGEVLWKRNQVFTAQDDARVYASSPGGLDGGVGVAPTILVQLRHADGGSMIAPTYVGPLPDGGTVTLSNDGGFLNGTQLTAYNCCPGAGCQEDAGHRRSTGSMTVPGIPIPVAYDVVVCDRVQRASPQASTAGDYVFPPLDPPTDAGVVQSNLADSDHFAEVHAFYHVNQVYDWVRELSRNASPSFPNLQPFSMRDERRTPPRTPAVWANVLFPDYQEVLSNFFSTGRATTNRLARIDNAAFMAVENFQQPMMLPEYRLDVDTLMIFQGNGADFGYDAPVLWHEFGHGVINTTAAFAAFGTDTRSANNEGGALHEGIADYIAAAFGQHARVGEYVGPRMSSGGTSPIRQDASLRDLNSQHKCPEVLWGEVHQDSQHFSEALWEARKTHFLGADQGRTFDATVYASLASMVPTTDFTGAAAIIATNVGTVFTTVPQASQKLRDIFDARGVTNCSKVFDLTATPGPRPYYGVGGTSDLRAPAGRIVPGPYQLKLSLPQGAAAVSLTGQLGGSGSLLPFGPQPQLKLLARHGSAITFNFAKAGNTITDITHDATGLIDVVNNQGALSARLTMFAGCGSELYLTVGNAGTGGTAVQNLAFTVEPLANCSVDAGTDGGSDAGQATDAGSTDGGGTTIDGGVKTVPFVEVAQGRAPEGCGCTGASGGLALGLALLLLRRRRQTTAGR